jgi:hypothetical protein
MTVQLFIPILVAGFGGGLIRGVVGFLKHQYRYKDVPFDLTYFIGMILLSGITGVLIAAAVEDAGSIFLGIETITPGLAFIAGYAGGDFIENLYKVIFKKTPFVS